MRETIYEKSKENSKLQVIKIADDNFGVMMETDEVHILIKPEFLSERQAKDFIIKLRTVVIRENHDLFQKNNENG